MTVALVRDQHTSATLRADAFAPRRARRVVRDAGASAHVPRTVIDDAAFVAGELVLNGARKAHGLLEVQVDVGDTEVLVRVRHSMTHRRGPGRGGVGVLRSWEVIKRLSAGYGYRQDGDDCETWARLPLTRRHKDA